MKFNILYIQKNVLKDLLKLFSNFYKLVLICMDHSEIAFHKGLIFHEVFDNWKAWDWTETILSEHIWEIHHQQLNYIFKWNWNQVSTLSDSCAKFVWVRLLTYLTLCLTVTNTQTSRLTAGLTNMKPYLLVAIGLLTDGNHIIKLCVM